MKILLATGIYPPDIGGPATYSKVLVDELSHHGIVVEVLSFGTIKHWPRFFRHLIYFLKLSTKVRGFDLIFAQDSISVGLPSMLVSKLFKKKFMIRVVGDYAWEQGVQRFGVVDSLENFQHVKYCWQIEFFRFLQKFVLNRADRITVPSHYFRKIIIDWLIHPEKVVVIYNGLNFKGIKQAIARWNPDRRIMISAGRFVRLKGFLMIIDLLKRLPSFWTLLLIGDGPERGILERKVKDLGVNSRVVFIGTVSKEKLSDYLLKADLFILNSMNESFSFQTLEAMSVGLPLVVSKAGALAEIVRNEIDGLLVQPGDWRGFAKAIEKYSLDSDFRHRVAESARNRAGFFSIEKTATSLIEQFKSLL